MVSIYRNSSVKRISGAKGLCFLAIAVVLFPVQAVFAESVDVPSGLEYIHHRIGAGPLSIHVIKVQRQENRFEFVTTLAANTIFGLATVPEQIADLKLDFEEPFAAVNADFFHIRQGPYQGDPTGLHIVNSEIVSTPSGASFWIDKNLQPHIGEVSCKFTVTFGYDLTFPILLNQERGDNEIVLYTPALGASTRTKKGREFILERHPESSWLPLRTGAGYTALISSMHDYGNTAIDAGRMVLSVGPGLVEKIPKPEKNTSLKISMKTKPDLTGSAVGIAGGPILVKDDKKVYSSKKKEPPRHPRTALGFNDDYFLLLVVDGRQKELSIGMTLDELAEYMLNLGCKEAMNLDGGGSSTIYLNGKILNSPSDGRARRIANALVVVINRNGKSQE